MLLLALTAREVATAVDGELHGDGSVQLTGVKPLESASESDLSFFAPTSKRNTAQLLESARKSHAGALLVPAYDEEIRSTQIVTPQPFSALAEVVRRFYRMPIPPPGVHQLAAVDPTATLGEGVSVGAFAVIGADAVIEESSVIHPHVVIYTGARIGKRCVLHAGAVIREFVRIGDDCTIQGGVVIGGDGFGYLRDPILGHRPIPHVGTVVLEDRVDVGANSAIDRATLGETRVREATKIDNLVTIGHNVLIGKRCLLCGQVGVAGSSQIGNDVVLGGQAGVADHITVADQVRAAGQTGIITDVLEKADVIGFPQREARLWHRERLLVQKLPELNQLLKRIAKAVGIS